MRDFFESYFTALCSTNNLPHKIFAILSADVYQPEANVTELKKINCSRILNYGNSNTNGYFSAAYNCSDNIVIAHRGTELSDPKDWLADWQILSVKMIDQYSHAESFLKTVTKQYPNYSIIHTGHSLGAVIDEILACTHEVQAVTFDSPGSYNSIRTFANAASTSVENQIKQCKVVTYLTSPTIINTLDNHPGVLYRLFIENKIKDDEPWIQSFVNLIKNAATGKLFYDTLKIFTSSLGIPLEDIDAYIKYVLHQHSIDNIAKEFKHENSFPSNFGIVKKWPDRIGYAISYYQNQLEHPTLEATANLSQEPQELQNKIQGIQYEIDTIETLLHYDMLITPFSAGFFNAFIAGFFNYLILLLIKHFDISDTNRQRCMLVLAIFMNIYAFAFEPYSLVFRLFTILLVDIISQKMTCLHNEWIKILGKSFCMSLLTGVRAFYLPETKLPTALHMTRITSNSTGSFFGTAAVEMSVSFLAAKPGFFGQKPKANNSKNLLLPMTCYDISVTNHMKCD